MELETQLFEQLYYQLGFFFSLPYYLEWNFKLWNRDIKIFCGLDDDPSFAGYSCQISSQPTF